MDPSARGYLRLFAELKRRRVFRVMAVYGVVGFVVLQVVDLAVPALLLPEWTYRFVALVLLLGFPVAIGLAWAFETTSEGVKRTAPAQPHELREIISAPASRRWPPGIMALAGMALLFGAWFIGTQSAAPEAEGTMASSATGTGDAQSPSIAVLPFVNMSSDPEQEYFSDGISEELLNLLAKIPELRVAARTSSFSFKGQDLEVPEIGRRLNVGHVLEGSVRKAEDEVRITAQLIRADDGFHVWSDTWDRTLDDIFAIQDEIASDVAGQLRVTLLGTAPVAEEADPQAYALVLQARHLMRQRTASSLERASELLEDALAIAPEYAAAWVGLARGYAFLTADGHRPLEEGLSRSREAALQAIEIDPDNAAAYATLGSLDGMENDAVGASQNFERSLRLDPNNHEAMVGGAVLLRDLGQFDAALLLFERAVARDPVNPRAHSALGVAYFWADRHDEAIRAFEAALDLSPGFVAAHYAIGMARLLAGDAEGALEAASRETGDEEYQVKGMALALYTLGRTEEHEAMFSELRERWGDRWPSEVAHVYAWRGDADAAFEWLDRAIEQNEDGLNQQHLQPFYRPIHDDPRWGDFLERTGTSERDLAAVRFDFRLPG